MAGVFRPVVTVPMLRALNHHVGAVRRDPDAVVVLNQHAGLVRRVYEGWNQVAVMRSLMVYADLAREWCQVKLQSSGRGYVFTAYETGTGHVHSHIDPSDFRVVRVFIREKLDASGGAPVCVDARHESLSGLGLRSSNYVLLLRAVLSLSPGIIVAGEDFRRVRSDGRGYFVDFTVARPEWLSTPGTYEGRPCPFQGDGQLCAAGRSCNECGMLRLFTLTGMRKVGGRGIARRI